MKTKPGLSTQCVHTGEIHDDEGCPHTPIYNATTFGFPSTQALLDVVEGRKAGSLYTRYGLNPTVKSLEVKLAALEQAETAIAFGSGMVAEAALFLAHVRKGIVCLGDAYGGTLELLDSQLRSLNIPVHFLLGSELDKLPALLAREQMQGFGGMLTIELNQSPEKTVEFVDKVKLFKIAPSLGGAESLVIQPVTTTHHGLTEAQFRRRGITGYMVRFSIGFEDAEDLIADLEQALA